MNRTQWKDLLEGVGIVAIIASLLFLVIETRNSTRQAVLTTQALEISAYQELMNNIAELNRIAMQDAEMSAFLSKAFNASEPLTDVEQFRLDRNLFDRFRHGDMAFFQFERGVIDEERLRSVLWVLRMNNPRVRAFWEANQYVFVNSYRAYINQLLSEQDAAMLEKEPT